MTRRPRWTAFLRRACAAVIAACCVPSASLVNAQAGGVASAIRTGAEQAAYDAYLEQQMVTARTHAEEVLEQSSDSIVGHFVLGAVLHEAEGSLARAMFHLGRAREIYETTWSTTVSGESAPSELHREILFKVQGLAGELEKHEYRLQVLGWHDYLYDPDLLAEQAWALIPLGRFDEAREFAERAAEANDAFQRSSGLNALCAIEGEAGTREPYRDACDAALENAQVRAQESEEGAIAVHAYNAAMASQAVLDYEAAEQLALEGARRLEITPANPWRHLARLYLDQGKLTESAQALREMNRWRRRQPAYLRDQARAETDVAFATVLLVAGQSAMGIDAVDRAIHQPDRRGLTSSSAEQAMGAHALLRRALRRTEEEREAERAATGSLWTRVTHWFCSFRNRSLADEERIRSVLSSDDRMAQTFRVYVKGGLEPVPTWLLGDLIEVVGSGVASVAVSRARAMEGEGSPLIPFYDALEAEIRWRRGEEQVALDLAGAALESLPEEEALLRARVAAVAAEAARDLGRDADALGHYETALQLDGGVLRRLGIAIPARVRGVGVGEAVADMIARSPRFRDAPGFSVSVEGASTGVIEACLMGNHGARMGCVSVDPNAVMEAYEEAAKANAEAHRAWVEGGEEGEEPEPLERPDPIVQLALDFQDRIFSAPVALSSTDLSSLDGRTTTGGEAARGADARAAGSGRGPASVTSRTV